MRELELSKIIINARFRSVNKEKVSEIASSVQDVGLIYPIIVTDENVLVAGNHRIEAFKELKLTTIPAVFVNGKNKIELLKMELYENLARNELTFLERGLHYLEIKKFENETVSHIAKKTGYSNRSIQQDIQIASETIPAIKQLIREGRIDKKSAIKVARMNQDIQQKVAKQMILNGKTINSSIFAAKKELSQDRIANQKNTIYVNYNLHRLKHYFRNNEIDAEIIQNLDDLEVHLVLPEELVFDFSLCFEIAQIISYSFQIKMLTHKKIELYCSKESAKCFGLNQSFIKKKKGRKNKLSDYY